MIGRHLWIGHPFLIYARRVFVVTLLYASTSAFNCSQNVYVDFRSARPRHARQ
jgi:hypothetical protein